MQEKQCTNTSCKSCLMPFNKDTRVRENDDYCSLCYQNGKLCYEGDNLEEFKSIVYASMRSRNMNPIKAKFFTWMIGFAPRWKK